MFKRKRIQVEIDRKRKLKREGRQRFAQRLLSWSATSALVGIAGIVGVAVLLIYEYRELFRFGMITQLLVENAGASSPWYDRHTVAQVSLYLIAAALMLAVMSYCVKPPDKSPWDMSED